jgi:FAD-linked oxidoreductase
MAGIEIRQGQAQWRNWTGDQSCRPARIERPASVEQLQAAVATAAAASERISVTGSGHSFTEAAMTDQVMIDISSLNRVLDADLASGLVRVEAGIVLADLNRELAACGLAMENLGDIDVQTIAGAISTGTHGTGAALGNISSQVAAIELVTADGELRQIDGGLDLLAARVGVGALGAIASVTLRCVPAFTLHRVDRPQPLEPVLSQFHELAAAHDHFEFFVFPYTRKALTIARNRTDRPPKPRGELRKFVGDVLLENWFGDLALRLTRRHRRLIPRLTRIAARVMSQGEHLDVSYEVFANRRDIRFTEMEYALPRERGPEAIEAVLSLIERERFEVAMPIECRVVAADDALLSPSHERDTTYVAVHQYQGMEWRPYFEAVEEIMRSFDGRPHWGKRHGRTAADLAPAYPRWDDFQAVRDRLDPDRVFTNEYAARVLGA